jgi:hypothetical protein
MQDLDLDLDSKSPIDTIFTGRHVHLERADIGSLFAKVL